MYRHDKNWQKIAHEFTNSQHRRVGKGMKEDMESLAKKYQNMKQGKYATDKPFRMVKYKPEKGMSQGDRESAAVKHAEVQDERARRHTRVCNHSNID